MVNTHNIGEELELDEEFIVTTIPASTVEIEITAKIWDDGRILEVSRKLSFDDVKNAIKAAQDCILCDGEIYKLTDLGREMAETIIQRRDSGETA